MRWSHKYHKGFNRLLLVITCCPLVIMVFYILLSNRYKVPYHGTDERYIRLNPDWESDKKIGEWAQKEYQKRRNLDIRYGRDEALYSELLAEANCRSLAKKNKVKMRTLDRALWKYCDDQRA